jgi:hypothetical protein
LNLDGSLDTTFNVSGTGPNDSVGPSRLQLDGEILIGGLFTNVNGIVHQFQSHRAVEPGRFGGCHVQSGVGRKRCGVQHCLADDSRIVLGGEFTRAAASPATGSRA